MARSLLMAGILIFAGNFSETFSAVANQFLSPCFTLYPQILPEIAFITQENMNRFGGRQPKPELFDDANLSVAHTAYLLSLTEFVRSTDEKIATHSRDQNGYRYTFRFHPETGQFLIMMQKIQPGDLLGQIRPILYHEVIPLLKI